MKLRYAVVGTGALGGFYGGMLAKSGNEVHFLVNSDYNHIIKNGIKVDSILGDFHLEKVNAYKESSQMPVCDVVLVCLKTTSNHLLKTILPPLLHKDTCVILIQNGLGMEQELELDFPNLNIAGTLAFICASKYTPGHITHIDHGRIEIGNYKGDNETLLEQVNLDFSNSGVDSKLIENLKESRWKKLVWNIPYNGMSVVLNTTTEDLMGNPITYSLINDLMLEVIVAANACGCNIKEGFDQGMLAYTKTMKPYAPSMKLDYDNKRQLEIKAIYSNPIASALSAGFDMPKVKMLEQQLGFIQDGYLK